MDTAVKELGATAVALNDIYTQDVDIFAPCALGAILNDANIAKLKCKVVAGAANNQLAELHHGDVLRSLNILYVPDYVINAGGLISVFFEYNAKQTGKAFDRNQVMAQVDKIESTIESIVRKAEQDNISTGLAADRVAEQRFKNVSASKAA